MCVKCHVCDPNRVIQRHRVKVTKLSNVDVIRECLIQGLSIPVCSQTMTNIKKTTQRLSQYFDPFFFSLKNRQAKDIMKYGGWRWLNSTQMKWVVMLWHSILRPYPSYGKHLGTVFFRCLQQAYKKLFQKQYTNKITCKHFKRHLKFSILLSLWPLTVCFYSSIWNKEASQHS